MSLTSKQRAYLMSLSAKEAAIIHIGKASLTDEVISTVQEAIDKRELIKIAVLKNCIDEPAEIAGALAENTKSEVVKVIGKKIILYKRKRKDPVIVLPR